MYMSRSCWAGPPTDSSLAAEPRRFRPRETPAQSGVPPRAATKPSWSFRPFIDGDPGRSAGSVLLLLSPKHRIVPGCVSMLKGWPGSWGTTTFWPRGGGIHGAVVEGGGEQARRWLGATGGHTEDLGERPGDKQALIAASFGGGPRSLCGPSNLSWSSLMATSSHQPKFSAEGAGEQRRLEALVLQVGLPTTEPPKTRSKVKDVTAMVLCAAGLRRDSRKAGRLVACHRETAWLQPA
mmetsp:Transcript_94631/g.272460  ORF Transcript_94631/g.272460 Transcript_94631/m.272460 type:complete len:237 (-) Transcript_94631:8-718(-)